MAPSSRSRKKRSSTLRAYSPPFWRDVMFWIAAGLSLLIGILIVIVMFMLLSTPRTDKGWAWTIGFFVVGTWIGFVILSLGLNTARGVDRGAKEADAARGDRFEEQGRKAGKVVGSGLAKVTGRSKTTPVSTEQEHSAANEPQSTEPKPTLDDAARSLGMMVGRRLGSRKDKS
ncbi:MAG: hypothetical protein F2549_06640 [Actinobacteria bacterium]|nr:hypothetical protein [Actinomycetota bacterium]